MQDLSDIEGSSSQVDDNDVGNGDTANVSLSRSKTATPAASGDEPSSSLSSTSFESPASGVSGFHSMRRDVGSSQPCPAEFYLDDSLAVGGEDGEEEEDDKGEIEDRDDDEEETRSLTRVTSGPEESTSRESICDSFFGVTSPATSSHGSGESVSSTNNGTHF